VFCLFIIIFLSSIRSIETCYGRYKADSFHLFKGLPKVLFSFGCYFRIIFGILSELILFCLLNIIKENTLFRCGSSQDGFYLRTNVILIINRSLNNYTVPASFHAFQSVCEPHTSAGVKLSTTRPAISNCQSRSGSALDAARTGWSYKFICVSLELRTSNYFVMFNDARLHFFEPRTPHRSALCRLNSLTL
jgi:hypothetical protein